MEGLLQHAQPCCSCRPMSSTAARSRMPAPFKAHARSQRGASEGGRSLLAAPPVAWMHMAPLTPSAAPQQPSPQPLSQQQPPQQQLRQRQQQHQQLHQQRQQQRRSVVAHAAAAAGAEPPAEPLPNQVAAFMDAFWKFLRPHTIRGTLLGTTAVVSKALLENPQAIDWGLLPRALLGLVALLCGNGYIVGINQLYDVDIDVVNKPYLPVAAGELSPAAGWVLVVALAALGLTLTATNFGPFITSLYALGLTLGTIYSVPPFHLKRFAVPAFLIIATVRGFLLNFGVYYATRAALGLGFAWSPAISFITVFVTMFAVVIAITKDLPDVAGDKAHNISTFATRLGVRNVSLLAVTLLLANYGGAIALALAYPNAFRVPVMIGVHAALAVLLLLRTAKLDAAKYSQKAIIDFYGWIWVLFYTEYACFVFV